MNDKRYSQEELEDLLSPRCEFRVSDGFTGKLMKEVRDIEPPRSRSLLGILREKKAIVAAASVVAVLFASVFLTMYVPQNEGHILSDTRPAKGMVIKKDTLPAPGAVVPSELTAYAAPATEVESNITASAAPAKAATRHSANQKPANCHSSQIKQAPAETRQPESQANQSGISASDGYPVRVVAIPITNPGNYSLTEDEIKLADELERQEFLASMRLDLAVVEMIVNRNAEDYDSQIHMNATPETNFFNELLNPLKLSHKNSYNHENKL